MGVLVEAGAQAGVAARAAALAEAGVEAVVEVKSEQTTQQAKKHKVRVLASEHYMYACLSQLPQFAALQV